ncbi:hypothetical protein B4U79_03483 [Dinothrombium tinctorium]|uniref:LEM domain-containing protein n=1 Tax=Dinothrombium tinctorium TaxID=1965070 RepID=A0A443RN79_9ACAR|nr:hypothetical protein B4U79_03483 [Dinothrombium tinctorium]
MDEVLINSLIDGDISEPHLKRIKKFIETKENINEVIFINDDCEWNILHLIAACKHSKRNEILQLLLKRKDLIVNLPSGRGSQCWTALHIAAYLGFVDTVKLLLKHGADPFATDSQQFNVFDVADNSCLSILDTEQIDKILERLSLSSEPNCNIAQCDIFDINNLQEIKNEDSDESNSSGETIIYSVKNNEGSSNETRVYVDKKSHIKFVERLNRSRSPKSKEIKANISAMNASQIREELIRQGESPGPITPQTKSVYEKLLFRLKNSISSPPKTQLIYSEELHSFFEGKRLEDDKEAKDLEMQLLKMYEIRNTAKNCFNYLLLDPRIIKGSLDNQVRFDAQKFKKFVEGIFYIGKGQKNRPFEHLYEARRYYGYKQFKNLKNCKTSQKTERILEIWSQGSGVVPLSFFQNASKEEALTRERLMISSIGISNLTNVQNGQNLIKDLKWNDHKIKLAGSFMLVKAYFMFQIEGEKQVRPADIR